MKEMTLSWGGRKLVMRGRPLIMGIVNVTPDSFSDGGLFFDADRAVEHGVAMARSGADILDIGGESTRPFSDPVSPEEEARRVVPVIERLAAKVDIPISIDTQRAETAEKALEAGASIVNDVSALETDPDLALVAARAGVPVILMHMRGTPKTMQEAPDYGDVSAEVAAYLGKAMDRAEAAGIDRRLLVVDPGIGFGKTVEHNLALIRTLPALAGLGAPVLLGHSRKSFIRRILTDNHPAGQAPGVEEMEAGTTAVTVFAALNGVHMVRVHDVALARAAIDLAMALQPPAGE